MDSSSLMARTYSKTTMPGFIRLKLGETGSGSRRHRVHTWTGLRRVQTWDPSENLWDVLEEPLQSAQTQPSSVQKLLHWMEMNPVTLQTLMGTMPQPACAVTKARGGPTNIRVCDLFFLWPGSVCAIWENKLFQLWLLSFAIYKCLCFCGNLEF